MSCVVPILLLALTGEVEVHAEPWPEADRLFHQDPRWLGADAAYTIPLGEHEDGRPRILWLFGDTFVARTDAHVRSQSKMARNTVAVQLGADPTEAEMRFFWKENDGGPTSFFAEEGEHWFWPQHGIVLGTRLYVFLVRVRGTPGQGLGFAADGWRVALIDDATGEPSAWKPRMLAPGGPPGLIVGAALNEIGEHVVALAIREPGDHAGFLVRWPRTALAGDDLPDARAFEAGEWWTGERGWVAADQLNKGTPAVVLANAGPESSLSFEPSIARWVHVHSLGFGATTVGLAFAERMEGPWSEPETVYEPEESRREHPFVYAAKAHPELVGADLVVTYASNALEDLARVVNDTSLYYPRFVRLTFER